MTGINSFSVRPKPEGAAGSEPPRAHLMHEGRELGLMLDGATLEAQFRVPPDYYLLILTDGCPYEESLHIYLLDTALAVRDTLHLGAPYTSGMLDNVQILEEDTLEFTFTESARYRLKVHSPARRIWNRVGGLRQAVKSLQRRHLELTREGVCAR